MSRHGRRRRLARRLGAYSLACAGLLLVPGSASATSVTFGADLDQTPAAACGAGPGEPCSLFTRTTTSGTADNGSPMTGVLVSARIRTKQPADTVVAVRVLRADPTQSDFWINEGPETPIPVTADTTTAGHVSEAAGLHHPINSGDRLAIAFTEAADPGLGFATPGGGAACAYRQGTGTEIPVGESGLYFPVACAFEILVQGTVESDADGDGYGDDTQDQCPTDASTHGACPTSTPPPSDTGTASPSTTAAKKKCKKKHKKHSAGVAKKKCKKKRR